MLKRLVNGEQCFKYWVANGLDCANCIWACPFNQDQGWLHDLVRASVKHTPWLNPLFLRLGDAFGYGRPNDPATIWAG